MAGLLDGVLPWAYSQGDRAKGLLAKILSEPGGLLQREVNHANDRAGGLLASTLAATKEGQTFGPATQKLAQAMADAYSPVGMMAWHGSPHLFNKFDPARAGKEGGTSFGLGHNLSADPQHAKAYTKREGAEGNLYKVDLDDGALNSLMQWEKPLGSQPNAVRGIAEKLPKQLPDRLPFGGGAEIVITPQGPTLSYGQSKFPLSQREFERMFGNAGTGEQIYRKLTAALGSESAASEALRKAGIKGIENNVEAGARNFVVFPGEESLLTILERNGLPIR